MAERDGWQPRPDPFVGEVGWQPRNSFLSVSPNEMVEGFVDLVNPVVAIKKLRHLFLGNDGMDGVGVVLMSGFFFMCLTLITNKRKRDMEAENDGEIAKKKQPGSLLERWGGCVVDDGFWTTASMSKYDFCSFWSDTLFLASF